MGIVPGSVIKNTRFEDLGEDKAFENEHKIEELDIFNYEEVKKVSNQKLDEKVDKQIHVIQQGMRKAINNGDFCVSFEVASHDFASHKWTSFVDTLKNAGYTVLQEWSGLLSTPKGTKSKTKVTIEWRG